jgi:hypothetical protein
MQKIPCRGNRTPAATGLDPEIGCAFIYDTPGEAPSMTGACGAPRRAGSAYCPTHHALCYLPAASQAERRQLQEIEALADAVGGKTGRPGRHPPPRFLRRLGRIARVASFAPNSSCFVLVRGGADHEAPGSKTL